MRWYSVSRFLIAFDLEHCNNQFDLILKTRDDFISNEQLDLHMHEWVSVCIGLHPLGIHTYEHFIVTLETVFPPFCQLLCYSFLLKQLNLVQFLFYLLQLFPIANKSLTCWLVKTLTASHNHIAKPKRKSVANLRLNVQCNIHDITPSSKIFITYRGQDVRY